MEGLFLWLITHFWLFSMSLYLCQSQNKWAMDKRWCEYWKMAGRAVTFPCKHFICVKIICLKGWIQYVETVRCRFGGWTSTKPSARFEIGWPKGRSCESDTNPLEELGLFRKGLPGPKEDILSQGCEEQLRPKMGTNNVHFWKMTSRKRVGPRVVRYLGFSCKGYLTCRRSLDPQIISTFWD